MFARFAYHTIVCPIGDKLLHLYPEIFETILLPFLSKYVIMVIIVAKKGEQYVLQTQPKFQLSRQVR